MGLYANTAKRTVTNASSMFPATTAGPTHQDRLYYEKGLASWYGGKYGSVGDNFSYRLTASGREMNPETLICAHRTLPFGTIVLVENLSNGLSALLKVVDRGPFIHGRIIDVSLRAAREIGLLKMGIAEVRVQIAKDILKTNHVGQIRSSLFAGKEIPLLPLLNGTASDIATKSSYVSPLKNIAASGKYFGQAPSNFLDALIQSIEELITFFKKCRLDPFISRKR
jgi:rare lipoprotein A (peptidoglycan hydrolase)